MGNQGNQLVYGSFGRIGHGLTAASWPVDPEPSNRTTVADIAALVPQGKVSLRVVFTLDRRAVEYEHYARQCETHGGRDAPLPVLFDSTEKGGTVLLRQRQVQQEARSALRHAPTMVTMQLRADRSHKPWAAWVPKPRPNMRRKAREREEAAIQRRTAAADEKQKQAKENEAYSTRRTRSSRYQGAYSC